MGEPWVVWLITIGTLLIGYASGRLGHRQEIQREIMFRWKSVDHMDREALVRLVRFATTGKR